jgi:hypothetical protein
MTEQQRPTLEERLAIVEAELKQAKGWRRRATGFSFLITGGLAVILLIISQTVPASSGATTFRAPFTVVGSSGKRIFTIVDDGGAKVTTYSDSGILTGALYNAGLGGALEVLDLKHQAMAFVGGYGPELSLYKPLEKPIASLGAGNTSSVSSILQLYNAKGVAVQLMVSNQTGKLLLTDAADDVRVLAGTEENGDGTVEVSGKTGKCNTAFIGLPCQILGH